MVENETLETMPTSTAPAEAGAPVDYFVDGNPVTKDQFYAGDATPPAEPAADTATSPPSDFETSGYLAIERPSPDENQEAPPSAPAPDVDAQTDGSSDTVEDAAPLLIGSAVNDVCDGFTKLLARNHETGGLAEYVTISIVTPEAIRVAVGQVNPLCEYFTREGRPSEALYAALLELATRKGRLAPSA